MSRAHLSCALSELDRLATERGKALDSGDVDGADLHEREIAKLLRLSWPCGEPGCNDVVTLGRIVSRRETAS